MSAPQRLQKAEHGFEVKAEVVERLGVGGGFDAIAKPGLELVVDELAPLRIRNFCVQHFDECLILLEFFIISIDALLPADQFVIEATNLGRFVQVPGNLIEFHGDGFRFGIEQFGVRWGRG